VAADEHPRSFPQITVPSGVGLINVPSRRLITRLLAIVDAWIHRTAPMAWFPTRARTSPRRNPKSSFLPATERSVIQWRSRRSSGFCASIWPGSPSRRASRQGRVDRQKLGHQQHADKRVCISRSSRGGSRCRLKNNTGTRQRQREVALGRTGKGSNSSNCAGDQRVTQPMMIRLSPFRIVKNTPCRLDGCAGRAAGTHLQSLYRMNIQRDNVGRSACLHPRALFPRGAL
jgi:hypothetical protein